MEEKAKEKLKLSNGQTAEELTARLPIPGPGRPKETEAHKKEKKARRELIEEYKDALAEALPLVSPALIGKAITGDVAAIRELNDVIVEKAAKKTELSGELRLPQPLLGGATKDEK